MKQNRFLIDGFISTWKSNQRHGLLVLLMVAVGAIINIWPAMILKDIVNMLDLGVTTGLWQYAFLYLIAILLIGLTDFLREYGATVFGQRMLLSIRRLMLDKLSRLPVRYFNNTPAGETMSRFTTDIDAINTLFTSGVVSAIADMFKIIGFISALFILSGTLGILAVCSIPLIYLLSSYFRRNIYQKQLTVRKRVSDINTNIQEMYTGISVIKSYGREEYFSRRFEPVLESHRLAMNGNSIYDAWFPCIMQTVRAVVIAGAVLLAAKSNGTPFALGLSAGAISAAADLFIRLFEPIEAMASELLTIQQALAGIRRVDEFFSEKDEQKDTASGKRDPKDMTVRIDNLRFSYSPGTDILKDVSLTISEGTKAAIVGRTGSGKTTLLNLIAGVYAPEQGSITIGGVSPYDLPPEQRRRLIGIVPQNVHIFNGSIRDNVTLMDETVTQQQIEEAIRIVGLSKTVDELPNGIDTLLGDGENALSFGQTQLLSLARAIVTNPPLLLLDELTSGLDALTEAQILEAIRTVSKTRTIITISHRLSGILDADIVHIIDKGRIRESGRPEKLTEQEGWYTIYKRLEESGWRMS
ncbi:MAG TPA: hypothetical protein DDZ89_18510 [Clostridiales bacterium]|nr:hypothetical protein [Clostridiales bacterium]